MDIATVAKNIATNRTSACHCVMRQVLHCVLEKNKFKIRNTPQRSLIIFSHLYLLKDKNVWRLKSIKF